MSVIIKKFVRPEPAKDLIIRPQSTPKNEILSNTNIQQKVSVTKSVVPVTKSLVRKTQAQIRLEQTRQIAKKRRGCGCQLGG